MVWAIEDTVCVRKIGRYFHTRQDNSEQDKNGSRISPKISTYQMQDSLTARTTKRVREIIHKHVRLVAEKA